MADMTDVATACEPEQVLGLDTSPWCPMKAGGVEWTWPSRLGVEDRAGFVGAFLVLVRAGARGWSWWRCASVLSAAVGPAEASSDPTALTTASMVILSTRGIEDLRMFYRVTCVERT